MTATQTLHDLGQSLWLDNITRDLLGSGTLRRYIQEFSVTGLTSNPTIFEHAINNSHDYDDAIRRKSEEGKSGEALFFELAIDDLTQAADLFRPIYEETNGRIFNAGADRQRLLWASTGTKDPEASDTMYIQGLAAPGTVNTMPEPTLKALADDGDIDETLPSHARYRDELLARFAKAGIDVDALAAQLQDEGAKSFTKSWNELIECIASKGETLKKAG